ncbi:uncharacterized protein N7484_009570 [Penicillium longicatenatum]|uniref:uncharacterized protein n=1 Tax=Penicillium longicatenatum TaxID=1561947 RepID=UPI0025478330|nr:uncharacterized protein N7484_009570 [Penicillium longicatenatum]KAJ5636257.1 hypothetical protein N7484_009570 [Penicillium longicatenatum]
MGLRAVTFCDLVTDLIQRLLDTSTKTNVIVCGTRSEFLVQLSAAIRLQRSEPDVPPRMDLLTKSIGLLAHSSKIRLTFCPSLESLRAYLAIMGPIAVGNTESESDSSPRPLLAILDLVALHATTTEYAAQGLSRTFAAAVEAASRAEMDLLLCECVNAVNPSSADWGGRLWDTQIPLLNGSVRIRDEGSWGGHGVSVKQVAQRWFTFDEESGI